MRAGFAPRRGIFTVNPCISTGGSKENQLFIRNPLTETDFQDRITKALFSGKGKRQETDKRFRHDLEEMNFEQHSRRD